MVSPLFEFSIPLTPPAHAPDSAAFRSTHCRTRGNRVWQLGNHAYDDAAPGSAHVHRPDVNSLDSTAQVIVQANPGNATLKSFADSTLLVLTAGIQAQRVNITTNLTSAPLYFVGIHRTINRATGAVFDVDVGRHRRSVAPHEHRRGRRLRRRSPTGAAPTSLSATIGDGSGAVNGRLLQVATGGAVTELAGERRVRELPYPMQRARPVQDLPRRPTSPVRRSGCTFSSPSRARVPAGRSTRHRLRSSMFRPCD